jgi:alkanesulfonate monooxygenase SsuD/methylene tetrahydromethanopterin reductase-like flavin-dependent oxidoreductase (luciferase family)
LSPVCVADVAVFLTWPLTLPARLVAPEEAAAYPYNAEEQARIAVMRAKAFVGTGDAVVARLGAEAHRLQLDEIVVVTWTHDAAARRRSYELIAHAAGIA